ncbi:MAG: HEAT repeat domain-containing protein [Planctomycetales bacterium]|nr:HEAT repeat domain-containing protein [Planctomycetales bacterium]
MSRSSVVVFGALVVAATFGCSSTRWDHITLPRFGEAKDPLDFDSSFANTKLGKVHEIQQIGERADAQSPAEQSQASRLLVTRIQEEQDKVLRIEIVRALGQLRTPIVIDGLRIALSDSRDAVRIAACESLANVGSREALDVLGGVLQSDPNLDVRIAATRAVATFDGPVAIATLQPAINDPDPALQYTAVQAMKQLHTEDLGNSVSTWQHLARTITEGTSATSHDVPQLTSSAEEPATH